MRSFFRLQASRSDSAERDTSGGVRGPAIQAAEGATALGGSAICDRRSAGDGCCTDTVEDEGILTPGNSAGNTAVDAFSVVDIVAARGDSRLAFIG